MSMKKYIFILISLNLQLLIKAEVPRNKFVVDENNINQRIEYLEREINKLKTDNRYLRFKLDKTEQKATKLEQEIESLSRSNNETLFGKSFSSSLAETMRQKIESDDFKAYFLNCLLQNLGADQNGIKLKETPLDEREILREQNSVAQYDEHFNCIDNCENTNGMPTTCAEALEVNRTGDGIYQLYASNSSLKPFYAYCLQDAYSDNAWMVIQRRQQGNTNFARNWTDYLQGFGDLSGDFWLGLVRIHVVTSARKYELWIQMKDQGNMGCYASYSEFAIGNETDNFRLVRLGEYAGDAGNSLGFNYNAQFSTYDRDNDSDEESNCAGKRIGGWWFADCKHSLNGLYNSTDYGTGINWIGWHDYRYSLKYVHIAIRPVPVDVMQKTPMIVKPISVEQ